MKLMILGAMMALGCLAQDPKPTPRPLTKFIDVKYLSGDRLSRVLRLVQNLQLGGARIVDDPVLKTIALQATSEADIAAAEELIRKFDVPAAQAELHQIQINVYLLEPADAEPSADQRIPADLAGAGEQIRKLFGHKALRLVETTVMQGREDAAFSTTGLLSDGNDGRPVVRYMARFKSARYHEAQKAVVINDFVYAITEPSPSSVESDLTIREGQKLVLGKITKQGKQPAYLVVTARVD